MAENFNYKYYVKAHEAAETPKRALELRIWALQQLKNSFNPGDFDDTDRFTTEKQRLVIEDKIMFLRRLKKNLYGV